MTVEKRIEHDLLGERAVPAEALWGIHTLRAVENFPLLGQSVHPELIQAMAQVKKAAAMTNQHLGHLNPDVARAIGEACDDVSQGLVSPSAFPVDALQGGAGTSTHMNVNEVLANLALEKLGHERGDYARVHPIEHVNLHQSTNDVFPTALKIAAIRLLQTLSDGLAGLQGACQEREGRFQGVLKIGRTEWQDAVPMTLGAEFGAFAEAFARDRWRTFKAQERLRTVNLGGTAIGTGITAPRQYIFQVIESLRVVTQLGLSRGENALDATANTDCFVEVSGMLGACAANLGKVAQDLRVLHRLGEIRLPARQAGSSIMPGKVNPVVLEAVIQAGMKVRANHALIAEAVSHGTLQINEYMPLLANALLESLSLLTRLVPLFADHIAGIEANPKRCLENLSNSPTLITAFLPMIGYEAASQLATAYQRQADAISLIEFLTAELGEATVQKVFDSNALTSLGYAAHA
jgi:aspartate ammonia-lyase